MGKKRGSRRFNAAVSSEKNKDKVNDFIKDILHGTLEENKELAIVDKTLANSRWSVKYYTKSKDQITEYTYQAIKAGNLLRKAAPIIIGSVVIIEDISPNDIPQFVIIGVLGKDDVKEIKKIHEMSYERTLHRINNKEYADVNGNPLRAYWIDARVLNQNSIDTVNDEEAGIEFGIISEKESEEEEAKPTIVATKKPTKRTFKTVRDVDESLNVNIDDI
jgi:hypothetical protein